MLYATSSNNLLITDDIMYKYKTINIYKYILVAIMIINIILSVYYVIKLSTIQQKSSNDLVINTFFVLLLFAFGQIYLMVIIFLTPYKDNILVSAQNINNIMADAKVIIDCFIIFTVFIAVFHILMIIVIYLLLKRHYTPQVYNDIETIFYLFLLFITAGLLFMIVICIYYLPQYFNYIE